MTETKAVTAPTEGTEKKVPEFLAGAANFEQVAGKATEVFAPKTKEAEKAVKEGILALMDTILDKESIIPEDVVEFIQGLISEIDGILANQLNEILHAPELQRLEGSWRGLHHMVFNSELDSKLKIKVLNISKEELRTTIKKFPANRWDKSPLFQKVYTDEFGMPGGVPYACMIGDYYFGQTAPDMEILQGVAKIAAAAHCPFIAGTDPRMMGMDDWTELPECESIEEQFEPSEYAKWRSFRDHPDSKYVGLAMPRFLARLPWSQENNPVKGFVFNEKSDGKDHANFTWANAAFAMGTNITQAFKFYGWCSCIRGKESGGKVPNLPVHTFPTAGGKKEMKCPTEIGIDDRQELELANAGFMALCHWKSTDMAAFISAQSTNKPAVYDDDDATANAKLSAGLQYLFAVCRFAHFLKVMGREAVGQFYEREDLERLLNQWIAKYVTKVTSQEARAKHPLSAAEVKVEEVPGNPGYYKATFWLRPHYQLEGLTADLCLVSKLPSLKKK